MTRLVESRASDLLAKGRGQTFRDWISALPAEYRQSRPRLRYWFGPSLIPIDQVRSRRELEVAFEGFQKTGNIVGQLENCRSCDLNVLVGLGNALKGGDWRTVNSDR